MKLKDLYFLSKELSKIDSRYDSINCGGCGFFAATLAEEFSKLNIEVNGYFLISNYGVPQIGELNKYLSENEKVQLNSIHKFDVYCAHIFVKIVYRKKNILH